MLPTATKGIDWRQANVTTVNRTGWTGPFGFNRWATVVLIDVCPSRVACGLYWWFPARCSRIPFFQARPKSSAECYWSLLASYFFKWFDFHLLPFRALLGISNCQWTVLMLTPFSGVVKPCHFSDRHPAILHLPCQHFNLTPICNDDSMMEYLTRQVCGDVDCHIFGYFQVFLIRKC